jgi:3-hydroxyacyl-CoA dehydrogenase/enoyl-CoA hydratase/3-hydroxybutyryl-CoA epimerase
MADFHGQELPAAFVVEPGKRGKKDGQGLYKWQNDKPVKPEVPKDYQVPGGPRGPADPALLNEGGVLPARRRRSPTPTCSTPA